MFKDKLHKQLLYRLIVLLTLLFYSLSSHAVKEDNETANLASTTVAVVNVRLLLQQAPQSEAASKELKERFLGTELELDAEAESIRVFEESLAQAEESMARDMKIAKERELRSRKRAQNRAVEDYREEVRIAKTEALDEVQKAVFEAIDKVREAENISIIIQDYVSASPDVDITGKVLDYLSKKLHEEQDKNNR